MSFQYNPVTGLMDTTVYPAKPTSETEARQQFMDLFNQVGDELNAQKADVTSRAINVKYPPAPLVAAVGDGVTDDSAAIQAVINYVKTTTTGATIENITGVAGALGQVYIPIGRFKISSTLVIPSYIHLVGSGRHTTILQSNITDGSPLILINGDATTNAFYNTLSGFSIDGMANNCKGIRMVLAHRWTLDDIFIGNTKNRGLDLYSSYIGDVRSVYVSGCGDTGIPSVYLDGATSDTGCHAVNFFGGEIVGSRDIGIYMKYGNSISIFGTTVEGSAADGVKLDTTISTRLSGMYFESNVNHITIVDATAPTIIGNYLAALGTGSLGDIGIAKMYGGDISSNCFANVLSGGQYNLYGIGLDADLRFRSSSVNLNFCATMPIAIETRLVTLARTTGTIINTDNSVQRSIYGKPKYIDGIDATGDITTTTAMTAASVVSNGCKIVGGTGTPLSIVTANQGSFFGRSDGAIDTSAYGKIASGTSGWRSLQIINSGDTASRPTVTTVGFRYFDTTLGKPIWWKGASWVDATGATV